ncbi:histidyl-tRNA synthetase [Geothermobacter ehrlichii]|uniref:ATP phosphoribosyltransferase regulatory subunit n=1 Tax=Geothermobacter ehrlichii TaxID=213224 RepID=A0A5D3WM68_9BACT|nr:ATP phosphoribosyltransferase regulatory subunit [Geothermobacter ehrlichii]TYO99293.1 histidyl-tRNA synthetase [Geothermobacter ehrlichii]
MTELHSSTDIVLPKGVKDFLPARAARIDYLRRTLLDLFHRWGFRLVLPAGLENLDVLERGLGPDLRQTAVRFDDRQSGRLVAVPPDITPQIARIAATRMHELPLPLRLCYSGRVLRHAEQQMGKDREIYQAGVELVGLHQAEADAEMIAMTVEALETLGAREFTIDVGQVEFVRGIMNDLDLEQDQLARLRDHIRRKDAPGLRDLLEELPLPDRRKEELLALPRLFGGRDVLEKAAAVVESTAARQALDNLYEVLATLETYRVDSWVLFDLGEIRGLDYHTGITFQAFLPGIGHAVCSGGRYDNLTARYGRRLPATGFTFNLLNLFFALEKELSAPALQRTDFLLFQQGRDKQKAQKIAAQLRRQGFSAARDSYPRSLPESLDYAKKMDYRYVMVIEEQSDQVELIRVDDEQKTSISVADIETGKIGLAIQRS